MLDSRLFLAQRLSALIMAPLVLVHLGMMIYAIQDGLSSEEILGRTRGSLFWMLFYGLFVASAALHGAIGLRVILFETLKVRGAALSVATWAIFGFFLFLGARAVVAVTVA